MHKVAVPLASIRLADDENFFTEFVRETYTKKLVSFGLAPIFISAYLLKEEVVALYQECSCVLFMGGSDIDPRFYAVLPDPRTDRGSSPRDVLEIEMAKWVLADRKPFLGICRGLQVLNVAAGGTLIQHIPDVVTDEVHGASKYNDLFSISNGHEVIVKDGTSAKKLLGQNKIWANSAHHQAVKELGNDLVAAAASPKCSSRT